MQTGQIFRIFISIKNFERKTLRIFLFYYLIPTSFGDCWAPSNPNIYFGFIVDQIRKLRPCVTLNNAFQWPLLPFIYKSLLVKSN